MTFADIAPVITALGGVAGIGAGIRWWLDRSERIRKEDLAREDAKHVEDRASAKELGEALTASAAAQNRVANSVEDLVPRIVRLETLLEQRMDTPASRGGAGGGA